MLVLMLILMLGVNDAIETNALLSSNARVNADDQCEWALSDLLGKRHNLLKFLQAVLGTRN